MCSKRKVISELSEMVNEGGLMMDLVHDGKENDSILILVLEVYGMIM